MVGRRKKPPAAGNDIRVPGTYAPPMLDRRLCALLWAPLACGAGSAESPLPQGSSSTGAATSLASSSTSDPAPGSSTEGTDTGGSSPESSTGADSSTGEPLDVDCSALPLPPFAERELVAPRGYHDLTFDATGAMIGFDASGAIVRAVDDATVQPFLPGVDTLVEGLEFLADGDLLYTTDVGSLWRVSPELDVTMLGNLVDFTHGLVIGPDGRAYIGAPEALYRVDLEAGTATPIVALPEVFVRGAAFDLDSRRLFVVGVTQGQGGPVWVVDLDDALDPIGDPTLYTTGVGLGFHDGLGIDACGNLYVPDYDTAGLYRVDPDGGVLEIYAGQQPDPHYGHGLAWGPGGTWRDDAIYLPQPYDDATVLEVVVGVPSADRVRTWAGGS